MIQSRTGGTDSDATPLRVLVCGGREFGNCKPRAQDKSPENLLRLAEAQFIYRTLERIASEEDPGYPEEWWLPNWFVIAGGATGADTAAIDWAIINWCRFREFPADWKQHGRKAGFIRNKQMLDEGRPDLVIAFPGGNGTANMVKLAKEAGIRTIEVAYVGEDQEERGEV